MASEQADPPFLNASEDLIQLQRSPSITRSIDNTALQSYMECPRKFFYSMVLHRRRGGMTKPALAYGSTWHKGLETHYRTGGDRTAVQRAMVMSWQPHENPDDHRTIERALTEYDKYIGKYGSHDEEAKVWGKTVGFPDSPVVEVPTELWWPATEKYPAALHPYTGKIDRIVEHQGLFYVEDHKTTSALGPYYFKQFDPSNQMMGYAWLAQKLTGLPIAGIRINAHAVLKRESKFERQTIHFSPERLNEWAANYNIWIQRIEASMAEYKSLLHVQSVLPKVDAIEQDALLSAFPHNFNACAAKYGQCTYTDVCTYPARLRMKILQAEFEENAWDPMALEDED